MKTALGLLTGVVYLVAIGGCASNIQALDIPKVDGPYGPLPSTQSITKRIRCELAKLADSRLPKNLSNPDYVVAVQLNLQVLDDGSLAPAGTYMNSIVTVAAGGKLDYSRSTTFTADLIYDMAEIDITLQSELKQYGGVLPPTSDYACPETSKTNLDGDLGLVTAGLMGITTDDLNSGDSVSGKSGVFGGSVQFVVTKNLNGVGPTWTLKHFKGPGALAGISEANTDSITFAFARRDPIGLFPNSATVKTLLTKGKKSGGKDDSAAKGAAQQARDYIANIQINLLNASLSKIVINTQ